MKKIFYTLLLTCVALLGTSSGANALLIDFTSTEWAGIDGLNTYNKTVSGIDVGISGNGGLLTFNADDPIGDIIADPLDGWGDGIGIGDDEISGGELLSITFDKSVRGTNLYLLDSFFKTSENEGAEISFNGGTSWITVLTQHLEWGFATIDISNFGYFTEIQLRTINDAGISDFSVAGIDVNPVPEPATLLLFGAGLAGLAGFQGRRKKK